MKHMHLSVLAYSTGLHPASWRLPHSYVEEVGDIDFQIKLAKLAEKGKLDAFFLGDGQYISGEETGHISYYFEPLTALAAISRETHSIGLIGTMSSSFMNLILQHVCFQVYIKYLMGVLGQIL